MCPKSPQYDNFVATWETMECEQRCTGRVKKKNASCRVTLRISTPLEVILLSIVITTKEVHFPSDGKASLVNF